VVALPGGQVRVEPYQDPEDDTSWRDPAWGPYQQRGSVLGMPIMVRGAHLPSTVLMWGHAALQWQTGAAGVSSVLPAAVAAQQG
jgi:hypothetical protein